MPELTVGTKQRAELVDITRQVEQKLGKAREGSCLIFARHTTCGILCCTPTEAKKIFEEVGRKVPSDAGYQHGSIDSNAHAHLKAILVGCGKTVPVKNSCLALPEGSSVFLAEFDGPQGRSVEITVF